MSRIKDIMEEKEAKKIRKLEGYRKKLLKNNTYEMDCPYCLNALSHFDCRKNQCLHCGYKFPWN